MIGIEENIELSKFTTFQIGGRADFLCKVKNATDFKEALDWAKENKQAFVVLGGGSNVLINDEGFRGLVIISRGGDFAIEGNVVRAEGSAFTARLAMESRRAGLGGLEFASGIPGTIAGAIVGNAGAYGRSISDVVIEAEIWEDGKIKTYSNLDLKFSYRSSILKNKTGKVILGVKLGLSKEPQAKESDIKKDFTKRTTDYAGANAGSYFKNLEVKNLSKEQVRELSPFFVKNKVSVGKIIESLGFKGEKVGGASVSPRHGNVIVNIGGASAKDILKLEEKIVFAVQEKYGVRLLPEIIKIGFSSTD